MPNLTSLQSAVRSQLLILTAGVFSLAASPVVGQSVTAPLSRQQEAQNVLDEGVQAFTNGQYDEATLDFQRAKQLDPKLLNAGLYLATTYASRYIPGARSEENTQHGQDAVEEFKSVLILDPQNISAIDGLGSMLFQMAGNPFDPDLFSESKSYQQRHIDLRANDPEPYYWAGVIDWTLSFRANAQFRAKYNLSIRGRQLEDDEPPPDILREEYAHEYGALIDEGIECLKKALKLRPDYDDAMAYLNLLYRRKADTVPTQAEREQLLQIADDLVDEVKDIKQKRSVEQPQ
jgi:tetratricopeptide (TPR) repeat protein